MTSVETSESVQDSDLDGVLAEIAGQLNLVNARLVEVAAGLLESEAWRGFGKKTPAAFLAWRLGVSPERARAIVRVAERREAFPAIISAFERGELSLEQVVEVVKAPTWAEHQLLDIASISTVDKLRRAMRSCMFDGDPDEPGSEPVPMRDRLSFGIRDGLWRISGELGIDDGRLVEAALTERRDALFAENEQVTWAEAFADCFARSLGSVESVSRRDHYRTWLHLDVGSGDVTTTDGWRLPDALRDHLLCDGAIQPVWERDGTPFSVGRTHRIVPTRTRRIVEKRDRGCRAPGCTESRFVEVHHITHWLNGGTTDTRNLISLCPRHHKMHHRGALGIAGDADDFDDVAFTTNSGERIGGVGKPAPTNQPIPTPETPYECPLNGRFDWNWIGLGWVHPNELARRQQQAA